MSPMRFVGRHVELALLTRLFDRVAESGEGLLLAVRGRRQVGKSRLVEAFLQQAGAPGVFFVASRGGSPQGERAAFADELARSELPAAELFAEATFDDWGGVLRTLARATTRPCVVVLDELPWLLEADVTLESVLQAAWDRHLSKAPLLLILIGSDVAMMERLSGHGHPLHQRAREMVVAPLTPADAAEALDLPAAGAVEAQLLTGGFPRLLEEWEAGEAPLAFLRRQLADATSPLLVVGERVVHTECPPASQAHTVLAAIGDGAVTFTRLRERTGLNEGSLSRSLDTLRNHKRLIRVERPLAAKRTSLSRYEVSDPYLRFWLRHLRRGMEMVMRGRGDVLAQHIAADWPGYRGRAVESLARDGVERLLPDERFGQATHVGAYWTRTHDVEVDLVGGPDPDPPTEVAFIGSIKWREQAPFDREDVLELAAHRGRVPGAQRARLVGLSRSGFATDELDVALTADDLVAAWR
jgi:AAA+ ATPase superfamily predicted ATPase